MNENLSIGTTTARDPDVASTAPSDADEEIAVDVKYLSVEPENVARFREQLQKSSKEAGKSAAEFLKDADDKSASSSKPNISNLHQPFHAKTAVTFDIKTPIAPAQTPKSTNLSQVLKDANDIATASEPTAFRKSAFGTLNASTNCTLTESTSPQAEQAVEPNLFRKVLKNIEATPKAVSFQNTISKTQTDNIHGTEKSAQPSPSKTNPHASKAVVPSETKKSEHSRSFETPSEPHKTAVIDTIPFLRTTNETIVPVSDPNAAQASKSHAMLIAQQIRDHIIDRILVSSSALNTQQTVTVQLSPRLLQDTEVQFTQNGTLLDVRLISQNKDSFQFLQQHQSDLQTYLQGELKTYRAVSVRVPSSQTSAELSQPHDGRSRNRFDYQSADEEETT